MSVLSNGDGTLVTINCPDLDAVMHQGWHTWYVRLKDFNAIDSELNLADVARIYVGVGKRSDPKPGGKGDIFIDEIQLLSAAQCAPVSPANVELTSVPYDFSFDCSTNALDLRLLSYLWLGEAFAGNTPPTPPIIKLDATSGVTTVGGSNIVNGWLNTGSLAPTCNFIDFNSTPLQSGFRPTLMANVEGKQAVWFDGNDIMRADVNTPLVLTVNHAWTVITTIYRDGSQLTTFDTEFFAWSKRNTDSRQGAATYSNNGYGSFAGWGATDRGWTRYFPALHQWHTIAITFAGGANGAFYAMSDGQVVTPNTPLVAANIWRDRFGNGLLMTLGAAYDGESNLTLKITPNTATFLTGAIAKMEVYDYYMTPGQIAFLMGTPMDMSPDVNNRIDFTDIAVFANGWMVGPVLLGN